MNNLNTREPLFLPWLLLPLGLGLIIAGFLLLIPEADRHSTAWLDLVVVAAVFTLNFLAITERVRGRTDFDAQIARLSVMAPAVMLYSFFAIGGVILGTVNSLPFNWQLLAQATFVFAFLASYFSSSFTYRVVQSVGADETQRRAGLQSLKTTLAMIESQFRLAEGDLTDVRSALARLVEDARFLSPCNTAEAARLENEIEKLLRQSGIALQTAPKDTALLSDLFRRCALLMVERKQQRQS